MSEKDFVWQALSPTSESEISSVTTTPIENYLNPEKVSGARLLDQFDYYRDIRSNLPSIYQKYKHWWGIFALRVIDRNHLFLMKSTDIGEAIHNLCIGDLLRKTFPSLVLLSAINDDSLSNLRLLIFEKHYYTCKVDLYLSHEYFQSIFKTNPKFSEVIAAAAKANVYSSCACSLTHKFLFKSTDHFKKQCLHSLEEECVEEYYRIEDHVLETAYTKTFCEIINTQLSIDEEVVEESYEEEEHDSNDTDVLYE